MWLIPIHSVPTAKNWKQKAHSHWWLIIFLHFPLETCYMICSGNRLPLLVDNENWHPAANLYELQWETYSRIQPNSGKPISVISWSTCHYQLYAAAALLKWISHIFWLKLLKLDFCNLNLKFLVNASFDPCQFSLDSTFNFIRQFHEGHIVFH
jgi:hypothetical protein